jgi:antitoxin component YwqK of YwqJK toxin-antitoxin module
MSKEIRKLYYDNGQLKLECEYQNGKLIKETLYEDN